MGRPVFNDKSVVKVLQEFNSNDSSATGTTIQIPYTIKANQLQVPIKGSRSNFRMKDNGVGSLSGVWRITERAQDGKMQKIHQTGTRKTLKILTWTRFQWVAIDPGRKEFSGTGGGTYVFADGTYTENIEFFSRDNSRVGQSLHFKDELQDGRWHHTGLSSKGDPINETWEKIQ